MASLPLGGNSPLQVAELYARLDLIEEAVTLFSRLAEQCADGGAFEKAIQLYKRVIALDPTRLEVYERLAELYWSEGRLAEARGQYLVLADYYRKHGSLEEVSAIRERLDELERAGSSESSGG